MKDNMRNMLDWIKGTKSDFLELIKTTSIKVKNTLPMLIIAIVLTGCAAFAGRETAGEYVDDAGITASVKSEIMRDPQLKMFQIHVETFKNQVQLSGFVDSSKEIVRAGDIARNVEGVQDVKNNLIVRKGGLKKGKMR